MLVQIRRSVTVTVHLIDGGLTTQPRQRCDRDFKNVSERCHRTDS
jgi:hypothetical protein